MLLRRAMMVVVIATLVAGAANARKVDVAGHRMHVRQHGHGTPAVVFDAGLGHCSQTWDEVWKAVRRDTRVVLYDRPGLGRSAPCERPRTSGQMVAELRELLDRSGVEPPYILVGHSLGGLNMRLFAALHPDEVAGLLLVEPTPEDFPALYGDLLPDDERVRLETRHALSPPAARRELRSAPLSAEQVRHAPALPRDIPIVLLSSPRRNDSEAFREAWTRMQYALAGRLGARHLVVEDAGHYIQYDRPDVVIDAIGDLVRMARRGGVVDTATSRPSPDRP